MQQPRCHPKTRVTAAHIPDKFEFFFFCGGGGGWGPPGLPGRGGGFSSPAGLLKEEVEAALFVFPACPAFSVFLRIFSRIAHTPFLFFFLFFLKDLVSSCWLFLPILTINDETSFLPLLYSTFLYSFYLHNPPPPPRRVCQTSWTVNSRGESHPKGLMGKLLERRLWTVSCFAKSSRE